MRTKQRSEVYYHVPLSEQEEFLFSKISERTPLSFYTKFFKDLLTTPRPAYNPSYITIGRNAMNPKKVDWMLTVDGEPDLNAYSIESKQVADKLEAYGQRYPQFVLLAKDMLRLEQPPAMVADRLLGLLQGLKSQKFLQETTLPTQSRTGTDPYVGIVLFLLVVLGLAFLYRPRKVKHLVQEPSFSKNLALFINRIKDRKKREQFMALLKEDPHGLLTRFQGLLEKDRRFSKKLLDHITKDTDVRKGVQRFLASLQEKTSQKEFRKILETSAPTILLQKKVQQKEKQQEKPTSIFSAGQLPQFFEKNRQMVVSRTGAPSPVFAQSLDRFLQQTKAERPRQLKPFIYHKARQIVRKNPSIALNTMNNLLKHSVTEHQFQLFQKTPSTLPPPEITSTIRKSRRRWTIPLQEPQKQQQQQTQQQQQLPHWRPLVRRIKKEHQSQIASSVMDVNIDHIMGSNNYRTTIDTLMEYIQSHPKIRNIYVVDAPNLLYLISGSYHDRQRKTVHREFVNSLRQHFHMQRDDMIIIVSQMNLKHWIDRGDPIKFQHILDDRDNIFHIRVGCADTTKQPPEDCFKTIGFNEMDDFVRKDLMARLASQLERRTFIEISNDEGRNWQFV